jgi:hypothetical protein
MCGSYSKTEFLSLGLHVIVNKRLKQIYYIFLSLHIFACFFQLLNAQELLLEISAEKEISASLLDSIQFNKTHENYLSIERESKTLSYKLQKLGYLSSRLISVKKENASLYKSVYFLGEQVSTIKIYYSDSEISKSQIEKVITNTQDTYFEIPFSRTEKILQQLNALQTKQGDPFAKLKLIKFNIDGSKLSAQLSTTSGKKRIIDSITIKGYEQFPKSFIKYYAGIKKGETFEKELVLNQSDAINSLGFAITTRPPEVLFRKNATIVYLYLQKRNFNTFDGILGFATNEETNNLEFNGYLNLELNNNLNFGEKLILNYKADGDDQRNFRVKTVLPYIGGTPFGVALELKIFRRDSTFSSSEQHIKSTYQLKPSTTTYLGYKANSSSNLLDNQTLTTTIPDFESSFITGGIGYQDLQRSLLFPIKSQINLEAEFGNRTTSDIKDNQIKFTNTISHIFNLNNRNSVYLKNETSILFSERFFTNELYRFGGINSIRGFNENSIEASLFSILNTEYRYLLNTETYIHSIIDIGYFENEVLEQKEKLYSFGIGLGLQTAAGLLKFNIANGIIDNQAFKFANTKIHLSLTSRF